MVSIGKNNFYKKSGLQEVPNLIRRGLNRGYFLVFEEDLDYKKIQKVFQLLNKLKVQEVFTDKYLLENQSYEIKAHEVLYFSEIKVAYVKLTDEEVILMNSTPRLFMVSGNGSTLIIRHPEREIALVLDPTWAIKSMNVEASNLNGEGVNVAILDSGVQLGHQQFSERPNTYVKDFTGSGNDDFDGHGTFCAGLLAGSISDEGQRIGVAPKCSLYIGKVFKSGSGFTFTNIIGIFWAIKTGCRVVSLSMEELHEDNFLVYQRAINFAKSQNCLVIVPAGNGSSRPDDINDVTTPGRCSAAITVGGITMTNEIYTKSNRAKSNNTHIDFVAPGRDVFSSKVKGYEADDSYGYNSGTSMAVPLIAGAAALLLQNNLSVTTDEIKQMMIDRSKFDKNWTKDDYGNGIIKF